MATGRCRPETPSPKNALTVFVGPRIDWSKYLTDCAHCREPIATSGQTLAGEREKPQVVNGFRLCEYPIVYLAIHPLTIAPAAAVQEWRAPSTSSGRCRRLHSSAKELTKKRQGVRVLRLRQHLRVLCTTLTCVYMCVHTHSFRFS